jgi:UDP-N-acetylmuramyl tripeptide synthase
VSAGQVKLAVGTTERTLCSLSDVTLPVEGHFAFHLHDVLAACGAAWDQGMDDQAIVDGLRSFQR